ncbi:MAG: type I restriction-modification system subunit M [Bifidobacteriaceae bacterium]|nr:type I restriction-modification system subunit M [Bifidobacteriaceae bacterium]MCI1978559.1 type I restriction-modification system subunit M [Bifidobacteriaceae bacterium]
MALSAEKKARIWKTLNETRGKIEPSEYKNYIFGVMFYKFLSEQEQTWLGSNLGRQTLDEVWAQDSSKVIRILQRNLGYVIQPGDMFSDWKEAIDEDKFSIMMVSDALTRFEQGVSQDAKDDFSGIFADMDLSSSRLGANAQTRTATMMSWINLMDDIELDEGTDVVGDLYEYLIGMFAANSGAKAGEFYTPHEVSDIMARILTAGREGADGYSLYDPTMGSGSLLLTTGSYMENAGVRGAIKYYGQEWITTTYNLARMNLMMHGIWYNDINVRNADTLNSDWPDGLIDGVDNPRMFDAVMANPPYSQRWDNENYEDDPRFRFGVAPKTKADYAFLLHGFYHLKDNGRMAIVLPHGVLFRGASEEKIRKALLENHNIVAIIGLPEKIFTNTGIPTIIMVLEKNRAKDDVLFIDASKGFEKQKNSNELRQQDIDTIVKTYLARTDVEKYAHVASMDEIRENDYNLNIPRYVDTFEEEPSVDTTKLLVDMKSLSEQEMTLTAELKTMMADLVATHPEDQKTLDELKAVLNYE